VAVRVENPEAWASAPAAPSLDTIAPRCSRCGLPLTRDKVQLTGKTRGVFRCGVCNVRGVQLHRLPGWMAFQGTMRRLSPEQRMAFWRGSHSEDGPGLREYLADQEEVFSVSTEKQATTAHAEWLPLKVWKRRGYPAKRIKRLCERKKDPTLGWVYRVSLRFRGFDHFARARLAGDPQQILVRRSVGRRLGFQLCGRDGVACFDRRRRRVPREAVGSRFPPLRFQRSQGFGSFELRLGAVAGRHWCTRFTIDLGFRT